jgi:hypothetical protein
MSKCWSFNQAGVRCELEAGHDSDHEIVASWTDAESWQPTMVEMTKTAKPVPVVGYPDLPSEMPKFPCAACDWPDPETHDQNPYGCRTFV